MASENVQPEALVSHVIKSDATSQEAEIRSGMRKPPLSAPAWTDPLLTVDEVASRLHVSRDWVWDHSSRKMPHLPVIRMGDGALRYRSGAIEEFINEPERMSNLHRKRR